MYQGIDGSMLPTYTPPEVPKRAKLRRKFIFKKIFFSLHARTIKTNSLKLFEMTNITNESIA